MKICVPLLFLGLVGSAEMVGAAPQQVPRVGLLPAFGETMPEGWMREQLQADLRDGLAGDFPEISDSLKGEHFIKHDVPSDQGAAKGEARRGWWPGEHEGYYADGFFRTAWLAGDKANTAQAVALLKRVLAAQDKDGYIGIYTPEARLPLNGPDGDLWTQSRMFQALLAYYEVSHDASVLVAVKRAALLTLNRYEKSGTYFSRESVKDGGVSHGIGFAETLEWLYRLTGDEAFRRGLLWFYADYSKGDTRDIDLSTLVLGDPNRPWVGHTPHTAEALAVPALAAAFGNGDKRYADAVKSRYSQFANPSGSLVGDEWIKGRVGNFDLASEYCTHTESIESINRIATVDPDLIWAERQERIAFNAAQGARHQPGADAIAYLSTDNRLGPIPRPGGITYGYAPDHPASCCVLNSMRLLPYYVEGMWLKSVDGKGLTGRLYGPSTLKTALAGTQVTVHEVTEYPFGQDLRFEVSAAKAADFTLRLRIPAHSPNARITVPPGKMVRREGNEYVISGRWNKPETVSMHLNFQVWNVDAADGRRALAYGPLLYALPLPAEVTFTKDYANGRFHGYRYAPQPKAVELAELELPKDAAFKAVTMEKSDSRYPWAQPPLGLRGDLVDAAGDKVPVTLQPMGSTILRTTGFKIEAPQPVSQTPLELAPNALQDVTLWKGLDDKLAAVKAETTWHLTPEKTLMVRGPIATPFALGALQKANFQASVRFRVPENCADFTSVALAFYDRNDEPAYAMAVLKRPGTPVGKGLLRLGDATPINLRPGTWYTLQMDKAESGFAARLWADGDATPVQPMVVGKLNNLDVNRVGVRVYGSEVELAALQIKSKA